MNTDKPHVEIAYCVGCNWLLRAGWMAQELLSTFQHDLAGVSLVPAEVGGTFTVHADGALIWERKRDGGFPDAKELKRRVRDIINPEQTLGHIDRAAGPGGDDDAGA
ncbi:SelT/SelW/SelH family protein [Cognatishimia sp. SS12]|uniref:SelT/SelW/SelH family protein n=1 Tax=Cognatishimia sp. SS12 TaxID=2979465 RepID=UPI00232F7275|nr:SelT/SelW/SelH family protein [Cognatishimia sp. SS12]MDC0737815.1 SelT/SelW/SelH family protein [Cognatishimia sp. SS12]